MYNYKYITREILFIEQFSLGVLLLIFTNKKLYERLKNRQVTMTIRGETYIKRYNLHENAIVDVVYRYRRRRLDKEKNRVRIIGKTENLGLVRITSIKEVIITNLTEEDARKCGYDSLDELINALRKYFRFQANMIDDHVFVKISFEWININRSLDAMIGVKNVH